MAKTKLTLDAPPPITALTDYPAFAALSDRVAALKRMRRDGSERCAELREAIANPGREKERVALLLSAGSLADLPAPFDASAAEQEVKRLTADDATLKAAVEKGETELRGLAASLAPDAAEALIEWLGRLTDEMSRAAATLARGYKLLAEAARDCKSAGLPVAAVLGVEAVAIRPPSVGARPSSLIELSGLASELVQRGTIADAA